MIITNELIEEGKSSKGGWNNEQFKCLGELKFAVKGWKKRVIGTEVSKDAIKRFLELKDLHIKK